VFTQFTVLYCVSSSVTFTLEEVMKAQRGSSGISPSFFRFGGRCRWVVV